MAAFQKKFGSATFQAQGPVSGTGSMSFADTRGTGPVAGTFKIHGSDSQVTTTTTTSTTGSATRTASVATSTGDDIRLGRWEYLREFGGPWQRRPAGPSFQDLVRVGVLQDHGVEAWFGSQLHRLVPSVSLTSYFSKMGFALPAGVTIAKLETSFWAQSDGTPAGLTIAMTATGRLADQPVEVVDTMDVRFTAFSGVTITAPATWVDATAKPS